MSTGTALVLGAPQDFTSRPARWIEWLSTYGGTATAGPNFSYVLATRALKRAETYDLSRLRLALNGAEPIDPDQVEAFVAAGARHGLRPEAVFPAFGMAEVAIAGTFPEPGTGGAADGLPASSTSTTPSAETAAAVGELSKPGRAPWPACSCATRLSVIAVRTGFSVSSL